MKKILAIVLAVVMLLPVFAVNVFAEEVEKPLTIKINDFKDNGTVVDGVASPVAGKDRFQVEIPAVYKKGDKVKLHIVGECNEPFRFWLASGWSGSSDPVTAESVGIKTGAFDAVIELEVTKDTAPAGIIFGSNPSGSSFDSFKLTSLAVVEENSSENEEIVIIENKEFKSWEEIISGTSVDTLKSAMAKEGAIFEASYTTNGNKGWGYQLIFETNSITEGLTADGNKNTETITSETLVKQLGSVDNISLFRSNYGVKKVTYNSIKVVKSNQVLVEYGERAPSSWGEICTGEELTEIKKALSEEGTALAIEYTTEGEGWGAQFIIETSGKTIGLEKNATDKVLKMTAAEFADACGGDVSHLARLRNNCDGGAGDTTTFNYIKVTVPASGKKKVSGNLAFVYVTDEYHAVLIGGRFLVMPHEEVLGYCPMCHAFIETEPADKSVFVLETTGGQDYDGNQVTVADGVVLVDAEGKGNARIATNWVAGGEAWNAIVKAVPTEDAWLKVTYTGNLTGITFQTEKTSAPEAFETTAPAVVEEGEQNVAWFNCADIVANSPVALSGDFGGWANFMLNFEGDTTVYGFEVVVPAVVPTAE